MQTVVTDFDVSSLKWNKGYPRDFKKYIVLGSDNKYRVAEFSKDWGWMCGTYYGEIIAWAEFPL